MYRILVIHTHDLQVTYKKIYRPNVNDPCSDDLPRLKTSAPLYFTAALMTFLRPSVCRAGALVNLHIVQRFHIKVN